MSYPDWAPKALVSKAESLVSLKKNHEKRTGKPYKDKFTEITVQAVTDKRMEKVWKSYSKRCFHGKDPNSVGLREKENRKWHDIQYQLVHGMELVSGSVCGWDRFTPGQKRQKLMDLISSLETIEEILELQPLEWPTSILAMYLDRSKLDKAIEKLPQIFEALDFPMIEGWEPNPIAQDIVSYVLYSCGSVDDVIRSMAIFAQKQLEGLESTQAVARPNKHGARVTRFVRKVCLWHIQIFGTPLYKNTAILASVFLGKDVDERFVVESFRPIKTKLT